ncbi:hypothetical protein A4A49_12963 [Nicotiana attenuata]|uniref:Uncharacterized protein n=2 Tax=Nicotiana attenuata TaxID=49451 RepID=A0A314KUU5_NICAT|nr:hypothetical protein A4A49_12963 [Nicotiana attenuata]
MTRQRKKLPSPTEAKENEGNMETPAQSQPRRWLTGVGSAPTVFHNPAQGVEIDGATVTPDTGIQQKLIPLTFGSFLSQKFQPIMEEIECEGEQSAMKENMETVHRRLQFSTARNTVQIPSAIAPSEKIRNKEEVPTMHKNRSSQMGKILNYVPPAIREGTFIVQIETEDTMEQEIYWSTVLIWYVLGDNPYEKSMDNYITNGLPLGFWSLEVLSKLASVVGKPLYIDIITAETEKFGHNSTECWLKDKQEMEREFKEQPKRKRNKNKTNLKWLPKEHSGNETGQLGGQTKLVKQSTIETEGMQIGLVKQSMPEGCTQMANDKSEELGQKDQNTRTIETRVKERKAARIMKQVARDWSACCNYNAHPNGRIWLLCKSNVNIQILVIDDQFIHCEIHETNSNFKAMETVVYASNDSTQRNQLWRKLIQIGTNIQDYWLLSGDFNNVLHTDDKIGTPVTQAETQGFQDMINTLQLSQVKSLGWHYTWCNKQKPDKRVYSRWAFGNFEWLQQYNHIEAEFLNPEDVQRIWLKLKMLKMDLKDLNTYMASYKYQLNQARHKLEIIQNQLMTHPLDQNLIDQERLALAETEKWSNVEEQVPKQKSRANWIACGDSNSKYFHAQWKLRTSKNFIASVYNDNGVKLTDPVQVENEFISFFIKLMGEGGNVHRCPNSEVIHQGTCLTLQQKEELIQEVTRVEILNAIKDMPHEKAPGVDGFPIEFFTKHWQEPCTFNVIAFMASSISTNLNFILPHSSVTRPLKSTTTRQFSVRCGGPRSNRGPLVKGRILSIEAIQAIQALKRTQRTDPSQIEAQVAKTLSRLIKADLISAFKDLLRQDLTDLALKVFPAVQSECSVPDLGLYADMVLALTRTGLTEHIDDLICDLEKEGKIQLDDKALVRLVRALIEGQQVESTVRVYELMKRSGWGSGIEIDEYVAKVLRRGFKRFGKEDLADEVDAQLQRLSRVVLGKN